MAASQKVGLTIAAPLELGHTRSWLREVRGARLIARLIACLVVALASRRRQYFCVKRSQLRF